jgi:hypothetical protein
MRNWQKQPLVILVIALLLVVLATPQALAAEQKGPAQSSTTAASPEGMVFDLIILRPLGLAGTVFGTAIFIVSLPFSVLGGNTGEAAQKLVVEPAKFTFARPLGQVEP